MSEKKSVVGFFTDATSKAIMHNVLEHLNVQSFLIDMGTMENTINFLINNPAPFLLFIDISNSNLPLSDLQRISQVCEPGVEVVVVGMRNDVGLFRDLVRVGVIDYLLKPLKGDSLNYLIDNVLNGKPLEYHKRSSKIISVLGSKGGVGATTVAINLAYLLAEERFRRVLLFDLDFHFTASGILLDRKPEVNLKDILSNPERVDESFVEKSRSRLSERLHLIHSLEPLSETAYCHPQSLNILMPNLNRQYHYIIFDLERHINDTYRYVLEQSSVIFIVTEPTLNGVRDSLRLLNLLDIKKNYYKIFVIINKVGQYNGELSIKDFCLSIDLEVNFTINYDREYPLIATNMGKPLYSLNKGIKQSFLQIVNFLSGKGIKDTPIEEENTSQSHGASALDKLTNFLQFNKDEDLDMFNFLEQNTQNLKNFFKKFLKK